MKQKVIQIGSSAGITMSKGTLEELGVAVGDFVDTNTTNKVFVVKSEQKKDISETVIRATAYIEKYRKDFEALADK
ncbi:hypothetical protein A2949_00450 [Candidatus Adlerbacteria bacterium RIFCSPLOWO2_01_FULL_54_21b]|uniref:SpoVT-AbrB domain-containing protein n=1 Tax=Candidatus Adlerbacteria bacterium RIFCSPLOWO2_01_FULL_54_21b TaxID=1797245 RepID=A0A1F4Y163_9BACT|nr:MAG: hypothetical protein A2949_00450 [Candidatus Adlerbacteria bacterium RIFCSPLOWO2_01_FULL_54_21b]